MRFWTPKNLPWKPHFSIAVASYLGEDPRRWAALNCLLWSLKAQTYDSWTAVIAHDGELPDGRARELEALDPRIRICREGPPHRIQQYGHPRRRAAALSVPSDAVVFTNDDNYYAPVFLESMAFALQDAGLAYCDMVHSHKGWNAFACQPVVGRVDVGAFAARRALVEATPWVDFSFRADGIYFEALARNAKLAKVPGYLLVHN